MAMDSDRERALDLAVGQIEKQFGKGAIMRLGEQGAHVRDIDTYHTREDKAAYNGGVFWPTQHYTDAGTATHRTYPHGTYGGGPAAEHNYNAGFMLHFFLTGDRRSRRAAPLPRICRSSAHSRSSPYRRRAPAPQHWRADR